MAKDQPKASGGVVRTSGGLRDALFDEIDGLRNGTRKVGEAIAVAKLAAQIINAVRVEIEFYRVTENQREPAEAPPQLKLGAGDVL